MRTYSGNTGAIVANMLPILTEWLTKHQIPYDELHIGKPWPGTDGFYVDDRTVRPSEFVDHTLAEIQALLKAEQERNTDRQV